MSATVPGHVYDEIDRLVESEEIELAFEAVESAIQRYFDPAFKFRCLWLFHRGVTIAERAGRPQVAIAYAQRFVVEAEEVLNAGPHVQEVYVRNAQIRPARRDEIAKVKESIPKLKKKTFALLRENLPGKSDEEIWAEVEVCRTALLKAKSGFCFIATAAYGSPLEADVCLLRSFRDEVLAQHVLGRALMTAYERLSPAVARRIKAEGLSGSVVRICLRPIIAILRLRMGCTALGRPNATRGSQGSIVRR